MNTWVCQECFDYLLSLGDWECFTDTNIAQEECIYCEANIGAHHIVGAPSEILFWLSRAEDVLHNWLMASLATEIDKEFMENHDQNRT